MGDQTFNGFYSFAQFLQGFEEPPGLVQVSAAQFNALTANGNMLGNAQILDNGSVGFPPGMGVKTVNGFSPLATGGVPYSIF